MFRLMEVLLYTPDMAHLRAFYERVLGLKFRTASPSWTAYQTGGALLALRPLPEGQSPYIELTFATGDLDAALRELVAHGVAVSGQIEMHGWGRLARLRDPEGNALALAQPTQPFQEGDGPVLGTAIVHTRNMAVSKPFYHHVLGFKVTRDAPGWVEFDCGVTHLALRDTEPPHGRALAFGFRFPDLMEWAEGARARGLHFTTAPRDEDWGLFSDTLDPDGHRVTFFEPAQPPAIEEELAEVFEDDVEPHQAAFRKPVKKSSRAASRVAVRPEYKTRGPGGTKARTPRRRPSATTRSVVSVRGAGPDHARLRPKRTADEKKARSKPATGRLKKAVRKVMARKKSAVARASKARPVKRGSRGAGKGGGRRGGSGRR
jgi:predicted enzyme related to lactoylglutathione lyase